MVLLPKLGETDDSDSWTNEQKAIYACLSYLIILGFLMGLVLAMLNLVQFLMTVRGKCKNHPMLLFYIWIIFDFIWNILWLIYSVKASDYSVAMTFIIYMPATFKILIGIEQIWLMIELIVQIDVAKVILNGSGGSIIETDSREYVV